MSAVDTALAPLRTVNIDLPCKLGFLLEMHPYKVIYSGRFGMKTRSAVLALLTLGANQGPLRILCCREVMNSIRESLHAELKGQIEEKGLTGFYTPFDTEIRGANGTVIFYTGLHGHSAESIKSYSDIDICLVDEANTVSKRSWDLLIPTIRKSGAEIWVLFNPGFDEEDTWKRWVVDPLPGAVVVKTNWRDAQEMGWFPEQENYKRIHFQRTQPDDYDNIWEGVPRSAVEGAIYGREMIEAQNDGRIRPMPYDPRLPVHTVWDLGWRDAMAVIFVQKPVPGVVNIINYLEVNRVGYDDIVGEMDHLRYRWGTDYLPHDGGNHDPKSKTSAQKILQKLGRRKVVVLERGNVDEGIKQARMMFPRVYFDNTEKKARTLPLAHMGGARLVDRLKRYRRKVNKTTGTEGELEHDGFDGCDAYRGLAQCEGRMRNEADMPRRPSVPGFHNPDPGMGVLG
jgi:phage terminase large subunit